MTIRSFNRVAMNYDKQNYNRLASSLTRKILSTVFRTFASESSTYCRIQLLAIFRRGFLLKFL